MNPGLRFLLAPALFLTGAAALVEEMLWGRMLHRLLGGTSLAVSTVLGGFLLGIAAGSWIGARLSARTARPLQLLGAAEMACGAAAICWTWLLSRSGGLAALPGGPAILLACFACWTAPLGVGFPLAVACLLQAAPGRQAGGWIRILYGLNAAGGACGAVAAAFFLIPLLGEESSAAAAAGVQAAAGALLLLAGRRAGAPEAAPGAAPDPAAPPPMEAAGGKALAFGHGALVFLSGLSALYWEVLWTRLLVLTTGSSTQALSMVTAGVLLGIAAGSIAFHRDRFRRAAFWMLPAAVAWLLAAAFAWVPRLADGYLLGVRALGWTPWIWGSLGAGLLVWIPAALTGAVFPWALSRLPRRTGALMAVNALGCAAGAWLGSIFPAGGWTLEDGYRLGVWLSGALAIAGAAAAGMPRKIFLPAALAAGALPCLLILPGHPFSLGGGEWDKARLLSGVYQWSEDDLLLTPHQTILQARKILAFETGREVQVTVEVDAEANTVYVRGNGKSEGSVPLDRSRASRADLPTQILLGAIPGLLRPGAPAAVIGLGCGATLGAALRSGLAPIDALELEPGFKRALERPEVAGYFSPYLGDALHSPAVRFHFGDARRLLLGPLREHRWRALISQPSEPWVAASAALFTREFFQLAASRLSPDGVMVQWVQLYKLGEDDLRLLLRTFRGVFNRVYIFRPPATGELVLVGCLGPSALEELRRPFSRELAPLLEEAGISCPEDILASYLVGPEGLERWLGEMASAAFNTDDRNFLEFRAPRLLHRGLDLARANLRSLRRAGGTDPITRHLAAAGVQAAWLRDLALRNRTAGDVWEAIAILEGDDSPDGREIRSALQKDLER